MRELNVIKPTGYIGCDSVKIYDKNKKLFYEFKTQGEFKFNLPKGLYYTNSEFKENGKPHLYDFKAKRKREFFNYTPPELGKLKVVFKPNPNKASVFMKQHLVVIDPSFLNYPRFVLKYILSHEVAHYYYKSEDFCDEFAQEQMLKAGYNKSQIEACARLTLHAGHERHRNCISNLKNATMK